MITLQEEEKLIDKIKSLSELEMASLLAEMDIHLKKCGMSHLIESQFQVDQSEEIHELGETIETLMQKRDNLKEIIDQIWAMSDADDIDDSDEDAPQKLRKIIEDINNKAA